MASSVAIFRAIYQRAGGGLLESDMALGRRAKLSNGGLTIGLMEILV